MAKKDAKKKDKKDAATSAQQDAVDAIRSALERTLHLSAEGAQTARERTREIVDEIAASAGRVRQTLEDVRFLDELKHLRTEVESLAGRVRALERPSAKSASSAASGSSGSSRPAAAKSRAKAASRSRAKTSARKPAARKAAAKKTTTRRSSAKKAASKATGS